MFTGHTVLFIQGEALCQKPFNLVCTMDINRRPSLPLHSGFRIFRGLGSGCQSKAEVCMPASVSCIAV